MAHLAVIGAGSVGAQAALALTDLGAEVEVFDRFHSPNGWGAHAGESRLLRSTPYLERAPGDRQMLLHSIPSWLHFEERSARSLINWCGGLMLVRGGSPDFSLLADGADTASLQRLTTAELHDAFPQFQVTDELGFFDARAGLVNAQHAVIAALELARFGGAKIHLRQRITAVRQLAHGAEVVIAGGHTRRFDRVIVATGAFSAELLPDIPIRARRLLLGWFEPRSDTAAAAALVQQMPSFVWSPAAGNFLYGGPAEDGRTVKIGVEAALGEVTDPLSGRVVSDADTLAIREGVRAHLPWLDYASARYEIHIDGWSFDERGILGSLPESPAIVWATAWSGYGFKLSPVLGQIAANLALGRAPSYDITHLSPHRFRSPGSVS